jgi:hypothetical protein
MERHLGMIPFSSECKQGLNRTCSTKYTKSATTITKIKSRIVHVALIVVVKNILFVIHYQLHHSHHVNLLALNQGVARFVTYDIDDVIVLSNDRLCNTSFPSCYISPMVNITGTFKFTMSFHVQRVIEYHQARQIPVRQ